MQRGMGEEVHLGLPGPWAEDYRRRPTTTPPTLDWPTEDMGIKPDLLRCSLCGTKLSLVAQSMYLFPRHQNAGLTLEGNWKVLIVQKCHSGMQTDGNGDGLVQKKEKVCSNEPSSTSAPEKHSEENKSHDSNDDNFHIDALAEALEQAATLASNTKKQNKSKRANGPIKCAVAKEKVNDLSIPGTIEGQRHVCSSSNETVLAKEIIDTGNDEEEKWEGEKCEYDKALGAHRTFLKIKKRYSYGGQPVLAVMNLQDACTCRACDWQSIFS